MNTSEEVRERLIDALRLDLVGPRPDLAEHEAYAQEILPTAPSIWYLTGFLVPYGADFERRVEPGGGESVEEHGAQGFGDDETEPDKGPARRAAFPSSMGLSVLVPAGTQQLEAEIRWGDYEVLFSHEVGGAESAGDAGSGSDAAAADAGVGEGGDGAGADAGVGEGGGGARWQRIPRSASVQVPVRVGDAPLVLDIAETAGLQLVVSTRAVSAGQGLPEGTLSVSVFLVNNRALGADEAPDPAYVFQAELRLLAEQPLVARPNLRGLQSDDWDEKVADLQYRDAYEFAVGHNVSAIAIHDQPGTCHQVRTAWVPRAEVEKVIPAQIEGVELGMEALAAAESAEAVRQRIGPLVSAYGAWIEAQQQRFPAEPSRAAMATELMTNASRARDRIQAGLATLDDAQVLEAFRLANRCIATAIRQRSTHDHPAADPGDLPPPQWRPFQLAFILMNLAGVVDGQHPDRQVVDLLFFPTGGGKTEAYLGLAAVTMLLRRLRDPSIQSAGLSVLMRYTLRLLTLDQLGRAATLVCALELERQQAVDRLGHWPFEIGLWVGQTATPNRMGAKGKDNEYSARRRTIAFMNDDKHKPSPIPLETCPWCGTKFNKNSFTLLPDANNPTDLRVSCADRDCVFHIRQQDRGLPILAVDEPIYRRLPAFIIATVDKFANLPWVGETAGLFGRVDRCDAHGFYGPTEPQLGQPLAGPLPPMDLVIQDELHLISGPLGTMVGLYETAIDALSAANLADGAIRPKIVASTATVRRAHRQIQGLFGRSAVEIFPPPGPDRRDSFFALTVPPEQKNARTYVGVAAQGRNLKVVLLKTLLALMGGAQRCWEQAGGARRQDNPADPYMTALCYFNSLRELGGARRIIEDEVDNKLADYGSTRRRVGEDQGLFANRRRIYDPLELTSRVSTDRVADTKRRLALTAADKERVDVALATNMISVGLDIVRLGLMVVMGQPKMAAEYIQATSRVGRDDERPGLVVTLYNVHRPRDRSYYERFEAWHESFYRAVEATSVTPFSPRAVDRGLAGIAVSLARLGHPGMTAPKNAAAITALRAELDYVADTIARRAEEHDRELSKEQAEALRQHLRGRVADLLDAWQRIADDKGMLQYQNEVGGAVPPLLYAPMDPELANQPRVAQKFKAQRSLRDVEPTVNLWLRKPDGQALEETER